MKISKYIPTEINSISIIGTSKNAGKTTLLNKLISEYEEMGTSVGIASIGLDGEDYDVWSGMSKPPVYVSPGTYVATSRLAIEESEARFDILEKIKDSSIGHEVYVVRTVKGGRIKLTGTPSLSEIEAVLQSFNRYGVHMSFVDGAYDRIASASPRITKGLFFVVGASYHRSLAVIVERMRHLIFQFSLPHHPLLSLDEDITHLFNERQAGWIETVEKGIEKLPYPLPKGWHQQVEGEEPYVILPGSLTSTVLRDMLTLKTLPKIIIQDSTRLFAQWRDLSAYYRKGGEIFVHHPIKLLGVAINPSSPDGYHFDRLEMMRQIKDIAGSLPIFDVLSGDMLD